MDLSLEFHAVLPAQHRDSSQGHKLASNSRTPSVNVKSDSQK